MIKIIFASVTGNTENVCNHIKDHIKESGVDQNIELIRAEESEISVFNTEDVFIIATSTWNMGEMNQFLQGLYDALPETDLTGVKMAFVGVGDIVYGEEHFCKAMVDFRTVALKQGIEEITKPLTIDGEPETQYETVVDPWIDGFITSL